MHLLAFTDALVGFSGGFLDMLEVLGVCSKCSLPCNGCFGVLYRAETPEFVLTPL